MGDKITIKKANRNRDRSSKAFLNRLNKGGTPPKLERHKDVQTDLEDVD